MKDQNGVQLNKKDWQKVNDWEVNWWGDCTNTFIEETKHLKVMNHLGLKADVYNAHLWVDLQGKNVIDVGGGVVSILLKCKNKGKYCTVVDPILAKAPDWIKQRYWSAGITPSTLMGENLTGFYGKFDEVWLYNVLQHVKSPEEVLNHVKNLAPVLRIHEWLNTPPANGHPHTITKKMIDSVLGIDVQVVETTGDSNLAAIGEYKL